MRSIREWNWGPALIAAGMSILFLAICFPTLPAVTAMALVALGATDVTLARFRGTAALVPIVLVHATIYGGFYAVFIGAALHAASMSSAAGVGTFAALDMAASTLPAAASVRRVGISLRSQLMA